MQAILFGSFICQKIYIYHKPHTRLKMYELKPPKFVQIQSNNDPPTTKNNNKIPNNFFLICFKHFVNYCYLFEVKII